ncbi:glycerol-3-phosphate dehydrogenase [Paenibacillus shirakamiensis]|uniref:Glycerol-3-phosphate dehydrogenase n=1 Tax=Paenibacillus shirakamiensis TaxID=1265935 RepID=A0ABS4JKS3_9BACL|nr:FAD-dependent oxidoreductase [Paenibacillus shirakamiensis]MBP2002314.1 glycerol-3-phosphate dehydrogenase [Paenibacillus shirakamiensis]
MAGAFSSLHRRAILESMARSTLDVLVIGGGITGSGIAFDAASRGMKTGLLEMQDFAAGTSSRSTKLVHGGLRYLKQFQVGLVAEVGKERAIVYENGPHVTTPEWMLLPIYRGGTFGRFTTRMGLRLYDYLAGVKREERRKMLSIQDTLEREPLLKEAGLKGSGLYVEYRTDDARLTLEVLKEAVRQGTKAVNYAEVQGFLYDQGKITGVRVQDAVSGKQYEIRARRIVNAAGPWVDQLRELDGSKKGKQLQLTKGVHLVMDQNFFPLRQAIYFDHTDGRMLFAIPRQGKTYVGTTDTVYTADVAHPRMFEEDQAYILNAVNAMFPQLQLTSNHVESSWTGLRPLISEEGRGPSEISRRDEVWQSPSGLITIAGGKLTGYRKMAESVVNRVAKQLEAEGSPTYPICLTKQLPISGGQVGGGAGFAQFLKQATQEGERRGLSTELAHCWAERYGSNVSMLFRLAERLGAGRHAGRAVPVAAHALLPLEVLVPLMYAIDEEMAWKPSDFFIRRTGALYFDRDWVHKWKNPVTEYMARTLKWTPAQASAYRYELDQLLEQAVQPLPKNPIFESPRELEMEGQK